MAKLNISPTKSNLLKVKETSKIALEGHQLLDQKREILVIELMSYLERVKRVEKELFIKFDKAYASLKKTFCTLGHEEAKSKSKFIHYKYPMKKKTNRILGMHLPSVEVEPQKPVIQYSFLNTHAVIDQTSREFLGLINIICEMAEVRAIVWRLSKEVKKVQRRVNALEKIVIPNSQETIKYINDTLEEREREAIFISKMVKSKLSNPGQ